MPCVLCRILCSLLDAGSNGEATKELRTDILNQSGCSGMTLDDANKHLSAMLIKAIEVADTPTEQHTLKELERAAAVLHYDQVAHSESKRCPEEVMHSMNARLKKLTTRISTMSQGNPHHHMLSADCKYGCSQAQYNK